VSISVGGEGRRRPGIEQCRRYLDAPCGFSTSPGRCRSTSCFCASTSLYFRGNYAPPLRSRRRQCTGPLLADGRHSWAIVVRFARVCRATGREAVHAAVRAPGLLLQRRHLPSHDVTQQKVLRVSNDVRVGFPPRASAPRRVTDRRAERNMEINEIAENFGPGRLRSSFVPDRAHVFNSLFSFQSVYYKNKTNIY